MAWDLRIDDDLISSGGDTKNITDKTLRLLVERALTAFSHELGRRYAANLAAQQRRAEQAIKRVWSLELPTTNREAPNRQRFA